MESVVLSNFKLTVKLSYAESQRELFQRLLAFISPVFEVVEEAEGVLDLHLLLHPHTIFLDEWKSACVSKLTIRRSTADSFNLELLCGELCDGFQVAWHERNQTGYFWLKGSQQMVMYTSHDSFIHIIEFFRYYLLASEAAKGSLILHASGVENKATGGIVAICGAKGAGKTSTMLNLTTSGAFSYFSGDKLLIDVCDSKLRVRGWPDYPHIGAGSLRQHPTLCHKIGLALNQPPLSEAKSKDKFLFAPELFYGALDKSEKRIGNLEAVILPDILAQSISISRCSNQEKQELDANRLFEDPYDFITATWHGLAFPNRDSSTIAAHQEIREHLYQLNWLNCSGNVIANDLAAHLSQGLQLRIALVASSGSGKSTTAMMLKEIFNQNGFSVSIEKLSKPLYNLQCSYFSELAESHKSDAQHQLLMEKIANNLRMLNPYALIDHLFRRLKENDAQVILTDDLRDKKTDWPVLVKQGYVVIRVLCDENIRLTRLNNRNDLHSQFTSVLDDDINSIQSDYTIDNNSNIEQLRIAVNEIAGQLIRRHYE